jgi:hypothetical protein
MSLKKSNPKAAKEVLNQCEFFDIIKEAAKFYPKTQPQENKLGITEYRKVKTTNMRGRTQLSFAPQFSY